MYLSLTEIKSEQNAHAETMTSCNEFWDVLSRVSAVIHGTGCHLSLSPYHVCEKADMWVLTHLHAGV